MYGTRYDNWDYAECWDRDKWHDAYQLFLECNPLKVLNEELEFYANNDQWSDGGFNINTKLPSMGYYECINKRAILIVIARSRKMNSYDWNILSKCERVNLPLNDIEKLTVNCVMFQISMHKERREKEDTMQSKVCACSNCGKEININTLLLKLNGIT